LVYRRSKRPATLSLRVLFRPEVVFPALVFLSRSLRRPRHCMFWLEPRSTKASSARNLWRRRCDITGSRSWKAMAVQAPYVKHIFYPPVKSRGKLQELLKALQSRDEGRKKKLFQFLNGIGARALRMQLGRVPEMCEASLRIRAFAPRRHAGAARRRGTGHRAAASRFDRCRAGKEDTIRQPWK
jgi:hypothetical protein